MLLTGRKNASFPPYHLSDSPLCSRLSGIKNGIIFLESIGRLLLPLRGIAMTVRFIWFGQTRIPESNNTVSHCEDPDEIGRRSNPKLASRIPIKARSLQGACGSLPKHSSSTFVTLADDLF